MAQRTTDASVGIRFCIEYLEPRVLLAADCMVDSMETHPRPRPEHGHLPALESKQVQGEFRRHSHRVRDLRRDMTPPVLPSRLALAALAEPGGEGEFTPARNQEIAIIPVVSEQTIDTVFAQISASTSAQSSHSPLLQSFDFAAVTLRPLLSLKFSATSKTSVGILDSSPSVDPTLYVVPEETVVANLVHDQVIDDSDEFDLLEFDDWIDSAEEPDTKEGEDTFLQDVGDDIEAVWFVATSESDEPAGQSAKVAADEHPQVEADTEMISLDHDSTNEATHSAENLRCDGSSVRYQPLDQLPNSDGPTN